MLPTFYNRIIRALSWMLLSLWSNIFFSWKEWILRRQKMTSFIAGHRIIRSVPGIEKVSSGLWEKILCFKHILGRNGVRSFFWGGPKHPWNWTWGLFFPLSEVDLSKQFSFWTLKPSDWIRWRCSTSWPFPDKATFVSCLKSGCCFCQQLPTVSLL